MDVLSPDKWVREHELLGETSFHHTEFSSVFNLVNPYPSIRNIVFDNDTFNLTFEQLADPLKEHLHDFEERDTSNDGVLSETDENLST